MGFRNPVLTATDPTARAAATAAQGTANAAYDAATTGIIPGTRLAADAINGKTITGATVTGGTVQTATSGARVALSGGAIDRVLLYSGDTGETAAGVLQTGRTRPNAPATSGADDTFAQLFAPSLTSGIEVRPGLIVHGNSRDGTSSGTATLQAGTTTGYSAPKLDLTPAGAVFTGGPVTWTNPTGPNVVLGDTGMQDLTPAALWTVGNDGAHYRIVNGVCYFQILATRATGAAATVTTFPAGARPKANTSHVSIYGGTAAEFKVLTSGVAQITGTGNVAVAGSYPVN